MASMRNSEASDIPAGNWIDRLPGQVSPYLRLARIDRPIGIWLLMYPCWWGTALATRGWPDPWFLILFALGATIMRGAGCTLNDIADRDFDALVARTAGRPIPSGAVSVRQAVAFMVSLCLIGLLVLLQFNPFAILIGASSLLLVTAYPFAKRVTYWPQAVLGLTFNWGALLGWAAVRADLALPAVVLYAAGMLWTLGYDTIYAHQDKNDDILIGIKSTALRLGTATKPWLRVFYTGSVGLLALSGALAELGWPFYAVLVAVAAHFAWQVSSLSLDDPKDCLAKFRSNQIIGITVFGAIVLGRICA